VNCGYTNNGWEATESQTSVGCTTTLPSQAQREDIDIRASHEQRAQEALCTRSLPLTASMVVTTQILEQQYTTPPAATTTQPHD